MRCVAIVFVAALGCQPQPATVPPPRPPPTTPTPKPKPAGPTNPIVEVASQAHHTCARRQAGDVSCWGRNTYGQLGNGARESSDSMVAVAGLSDATQLVTGQDYACALRIGGSVVCWGNNQDGQLGDGRGAKVGAIGLRPVKVGGLARVTQLAAGDWHVCALDSGGGVWCWGNGENGQIGNDASRAFARPVRIEQLDAAKQIVSGSGHVCALQRDGRAKCWGRNTEGQLGDGKSGSKIKPVFVSGIAGATALWSGHTFTCASLEDGALRCWGDNKHGQLGREGGRDPKWNAPIPLAGIRDVVQLVGGQTHACALLGNGRVMCWGGNEDGRAVGRGTGVVASPTAVRGVSDAVGIAAGAGHTCAALRSGEATCWGGSDNGEVDRYRLAAAGDFGYDPLHADTRGRAPFGPRRL